MSDLNDPRVLFAAERTLLAWTRTASGMIAFGFLIDRAAILTPGHSSDALALGIGVAFILLGVLMSGLSVVQYRKAVADLRPIEIPPHYWVNMAAYTSITIAALGVLLAAYIVISR